MAFTLWTLFEASLLCLNAVCVLHEERFLAKGKTFVRHENSLKYLFTFAKIPIFMLKILPVTPFKII
jgi:Yos1-like